MQFKRTHVKITILLVLHGQYLFSVHLKAGLDQKSGIRYQMKVLSAHTKYQFLLIKSIWSMHLHC
ncbi:hypothetical protein D3C77_379550 [compost metagenome]